MYIALAARRKKLPRCGGYVAARHVFTPVLVTLASSISRDTAFYYCNRNHGVVVMASCEIDDIVALEHPFKLTFSSKFGDFYNTEKRRYLRF